MKSKVHADNIIAVIRANTGIESKAIASQLGLSVAQFQSASPFLKKECYRSIKKWYMKRVEAIPMRIRRSPTATIIYRMMPVSQMGLKEKMGMHKDAIWRALKLLKDYKLIHITGYETNKTTIFPMFAAGYGVDATRPTGKALANQRSNRYKSNNPEAVKAKNATYRLKNKELLNEKQKARYRANAEAINIIARAKLAAKKLKPVEKPIVTQWRTELPWKQNIAQT